MIVDDHPGVSEMLKMQCVAWGLSCEMVSASGSQVLDRLYAAYKSEQPFALLLMKQDLPGMDGMTLVRMIRSAPELSKLSVILLVPMGHPKLKQLDKEEQVNVVVTKPVRSKALYEGITQALGMTTVKPSVPSIVPDRIKYSARILLVEDNHTNQEVATIMLQGLGCEVVIADTGIKALDLWRENNFNLILMDCLMPEMDGFETTRRLRQQEQTSNLRIPIIALTADTSQETRAQCRTAGMDDFLGKPLVIKQLNKTLERWLIPIDKELSQGDPAEINSQEQIMEEGSSSLLDAEVLREITLLQQPDQPDLIRRVVEIFLKESPRLLADIEGAVTAGDFDSLRRNAHSLKSSSAHIGAETLSQYAKELEIHGRNQNLTGVDQIVKSIKQDYQVLVLALEAEVLKRTA